MLLIIDRLSVRYLFRIAFAAGLFLVNLTLSAYDENDHDSSVIQTSVGVLVPVDAKTNADWLAKAQAAYPNFCPVCNDHIKTVASSDVPEYIYRVTGKPDRLVRFCGEDECVASFKKDPDKYLKLIDDAATKK